MLLTFSPASDTVGKITVGFCLLISGCGHLATQPASLILENAAGNSLELRETPFFPQQRNHCGPAAAATVLAMSGVEVTPSELVPKVYLPERKGSLQVELLAAIRRYARVPYPIKSGLAAVLAELQAGRPVLVLQNLGLKRYPVWHYAVVIGVDVDRSQVILRSGARKREVMSASRFLETWKRGDFWAVVVLRPGELPAKPEQNTYLQAVAVLEASGYWQAAARAYAAGLRQWPDNALLRLGLGNAYYGQGKLTEAETLFRQLVALHPAHVVGYNNLAQVLYERGCYNAALGAIEAALAARVPTEGLRSTIERTRLEILNKQRQVKVETNAGCM